jgi:hypothetical protein
MTNRILRLLVRDRRLTPAEAELWVEMVAEQVTPMTELRGRLMGPRCAYASTVEIAYPLRPLTRQAPQTLGLIRRVIIPEPSLWDPISPFLYQGPIELWQEGQLCESVSITHGLRALGSTRNPRWNGHPLTLTGVPLEGGTESDLARLRAAGVNTLLVPATDGSEHWWTAADRFGFLVLGRISEPAPPADAVSRLSAHPSALGWILVEGAIPRGEDPRFMKALAGPAATTWIGIELSRVPEKLPPWVQFHLCREALAPSLSSSPLPFILLAEGETSAEGVPERLLSLPRVIGVIVQP